MLCGDTHEARSMGECLQHSYKILHNLWSSSPTSSVYYMIENARNKEKEIKNKEKFFDTLLSRSYVYGKLHEKYLSYIYLLVIIHCQYKYVIIR